MHRSTGEVTRLLREVGAGREEALADLLPLVYQELRALASSYLKRERVDHTLQPTALVHEAYLKLVDQRNRNWESRQHFMALSATAMRRVLVNHAKHQQRQKRGGGWRREDLDATAARAGDGQDIDLVGLDEALERLAARDPRKVRVVELKFFVGLSIDETAELLDVSAATVKRDWELARTWLLREMTGDDPGSDH